MAFGGKNNFQKSSGACPGAKGDFGGVWYKGGMTKAEVRSQSSEWGRCRVRRSQTAATPRTRTGTVREPAGGDACATRPAASVKLRPAMSDYNYWGNSASRTSFFPSEGRRRRRRCPRGWKLRNEPISKNSKSPDAACMKPVFCDFFGRQNEPISGNLRLPIADCRLK